jgi:ribosomal-protein-alanine N-acetyltransferase
MRIEIKPASIFDLQTLYEIEKECFSFEAFSLEQIAFLLDNPNSISLVAVVENEIVGFIIGLVYENVKIGNVGHILTLDVATKHRRKGVAMKLLQELERKFREKGIKACFLEVRFDNEAAKRLYEKLGYREIACLRNYYGKGIHGLRFKKILD